MIWRSSASFPLHVCRAIQTSTVANQRLHLSSLRTLIPNVATVLANPFANDQHTITVVGSVRTIRKQKHLSFVELGDGSTVQSLQAVLDPSQAEGLGTGTSVEITGEWRSAPPHKEQSHELKADYVRVIGTSNAEKYPIQKKFHSAEFLRSIPHLRLRTPLNALLARIRSECDFHLASFFRDHQFVRLQPPIITSSDCEGAGEVFTISSNKSAACTDSDKPSSDVQNDEFFKEPKYLTVSSQLHLEAFVHEHHRVWTLSPTFRAEKSDTPRHVSEFWMLEVEMRIQNLQELMDLVENMIRTLTVKLQGSGIRTELEYAHRSGKYSKAMGTQNILPLDERWHGLTHSSWPRITYGDAIQRLQDAVRSNQVTFQHEPSWPNGLQLEHEKYLAAVVGQGSPVFVTDYPQDIKPFYMLPSSFETAADAAERPTVACFDLLFPDACEVVGGSLREHRLLELTQSLRIRNLNVSSGGDVNTKPNGDLSPSVEPGNLDWYLDLRRYGSVPHGGFGLGFDRLLGYLAGVGNLKDVVPWPRHYGRCEC